MSTLESGLLIALFTAVVGSLLAWVVGTQVTYLWDDQKRRRESDLAAVATFYRLYGEFFATWKLWSAYKDKQGRLKPEADLRWTLLERAEVAESGFEALLVKLASERRLSADDEQMLGCFREGYQTLRESIEADAKLPWKASDSPDSAKHKSFAEYRAFKALAQYVAQLLAVPPKRDLLARMRTPTPPQPDVATAIESFQRITQRNQFANGKWRDLATQTLRLGSGEGEAPLRTSPGRAKELPSSTADRSEVGDTTRPSGAGDIAVSVGTGDVAGKDAR